MKALAASGSFATVKTPRLKWPYSISSAGKRSEILGAGDRLNDVGLLEADFDVARPPPAVATRAALDDFDLVLDLIVDAEFLKQPRVERPGTVAAVADRLGVEHRLLEAFPPC